MFVSRTTLRGVASRSRFMDDANHVSFLDSEFPGLSSPVIHQLLFFGEKLLRRRRVSLGFAEDPGDPLQVLLTVPSLSSGLVLPKGLADEFTHRTIFSSGDPFRFLDHS